MQLLEQRTLTYGFVYQLAKPAIPPVAPLPPMRYPVPRRNLGRRFLSGPGGEDGTGGWLATRALEPPLTRIQDGAKTGKGGALKRDEYTRYKREILKHETLASHGGSFRWAHARPATAFVHYLHDQLLPTGRREKSAGGMELIVGGETRSGRLAR